MPRQPGSKDTRPRKRRCDKLDDAEKVLRAQRSARQSKIKKREERGAERRAALGCASLFDMVRFVPALALVQTCDSHLLQGLVTTGATTSRPPESSSASAASGTPLVSSSAQGCSDDSHHEMRGTEDSMSSDDDAPGLVDSDSDDEASNVTAMDVSSAMQAHTAFDDRLTRGAEAQENLRGTQDGDAATRFRERLASFQELLNEANTLGYERSPTEDAWRSILGDIFHFIDRIKVGTHHSYRKAFCAAYREAWLIFDPDIHKTTNDVLRTKHDMDEDEIDRKKLFDFDYFRKRVPRYAPSARILHARVKAMFETFGDQKDLETGLPLFNQRAWDTANNILTEIGDGHGSDSPGVSFYTYKLDPKTRKPMVDSDGLYLYKSLRGTNAVERFHRKLREFLGSWHCGVELAVCLLSEFIHRHKHAQAVLHDLDYVNEHSTFTGFRRTTTLPSLRRCWTTGLKSPSDLRAVVIGRAPEVDARGSSARWSTRHHPQEMSASLTGSLRTCSLESMRGSASETQPASAITQTLRP